MLHQNAAGVAGGVAHSRATGGLVRPLRAGLFPLALFVVFAAVHWWGSAGSGTPAWLERAAELGDELRERGTNLFALLDPQEDPRVGPGVLLLRVGVGRSAAAAMAGILGLGLGAVAILLVGARRPASPGTRIAPWLLAASPLWVEAGIQGDPNLVLGLLLLAAPVTRAQWILWAVAAGWALGWTPWAWIVLVAVAATGLMQAERRKGAAAALLAGLVLVWLLNPPALQHPGRWFADMIWQARLTGLGSAAVRFGTQSNLGPLFNSLHIPALVCLAWNARRWPVRLRHGDLTPLAFAVVLGLALPTGFAERAPLLIVLPWAAREAAAGLGDLLDRLAPVRLPLRAVRWGLTALLLTPLAVVSLVGVSRGMRPANAQTDAFAWLEQELPPGTLGVHDMGSATPDTSRLVWLTIPFHSLDPGTCRGAYWLGWYHSFGAIVLSERMINRFLRRAVDYPDIIDFYVSVRRSARREETFGTRPGDRLHAVLPGRSNQPDLGEGWEGRVRSGLHGGLPGTFLAALGGALVRGGQTVTGTTLLREALAAGYRDVGIYVNLASGELAVDRFLEAGAVLEEGLREHPGTPELLYNLGLVLMRAEYWDRAVSTLGTLAETWPRSAQVRYLLGVSLVHAGYPEPGKRALVEALALDAQFPQRHAIERMLQDLEAGARK